MPKSKELQVQASASLKSERNRVEQGKDEFTHGTEHNSIGL